MEIRQPSSFLCQNPEPGKWDFSNEWERRWQGWAGDGDMRHMIWETAIPMLLTVGRENICTLLCLNIETYTSLLTVVMRSLRYTVLFKDLS